MPTHVDGTAEEGDQSLDGRGISGDALGRAEAARAGLPGQLGSGEGQRLFGQIFRQPGGVACAGSQPWASRS